MNVNICDVSFAHVDYGWNGDLTDVESPITWDRHFDATQESDMCFFTDMVLYRVDSIDAKIKVALLIEPVVIFPNSYNFIIENYNKFDYVLTHNLNLLKYIPNGVYYPHGGAWIEKKDWGVHPKSRNISLIASQKKVTVGQKIRHDIVSTYKDKIDFVCGRGYSPIDNKIDALKDFRASIVVENGIIGDYFSEKLIDCFLTGTVPIYWNDGFISKYFNIDGMLTFTSFDELKIIMKIDSEEFYNKNIGAIKENFELAKQYANTETWIYENFLKGILNHD